MMQREEEKLRSGFLELNVCADGFAMAETTQSALEAEMKEIFVPYRGFFNRNGVNVITTIMQKTSKTYQDDCW